MAKNAEIRAKRKKRFLRKFKKNSKKNTKNFKNFQKFQKKEKKVKFPRENQKIFSKISWKKYQNYSATNNSLSFCIDKIFAFNKVVKQLIPEPLNLQ